MKTDYAIYQFLATGPEAFRVLTGGKILAGPYRFSSPTLKGLERRIDALFEPQNHNGPVYVVEFQVQWQAAAWYNLLTKIGLYGEEHPQQRVQGILIFPRKTDEPKMSRWMVPAAPDLLSVVYLDQCLPALLAQEPNNPFVAVFAPFILDSDEALTQQAPRLWQTLHSASLPEAVRVRLEQILEFWFFERFKTLTAQEIYAMLQTLVPLEETRAYQDILAKGIAKGEAKGEARGIAKGEALLLKRQIVRRFGALPDWAQARIDAAAAAQLDVWAEAIFDARDIEQLLAG